MIFYVVVALGGVVVVQYVVHLGRGLHVHRTLSPNAAPSAPPGPDNFVWVLLLALAVVLVASRLFGALFRRLGQPQVVGEIVAGLALGPSAFGRLLPKVSSVVFSHQALPLINGFAQIGLVFYMFLIGLEFDRTLLRGRGKAAAVISHASIFVPFLAGTALALVLYPRFGSPTGRFTPFALFLGASMSVTAFPVLARILAERGLLNSRAGTIALTCAAVDDITAWCVLAVVVAITRSAGWTGPLLTLVLTLAFVAFLLLVVRPLLERVATSHRRLGQLPPSYLAMLFLGILLSSLITDRMGIHPVFGAFLFGAAMPQCPELVQDLRNKLEPFTVVFLLPLFFAYTGLRTNLALLAGPGMWTAFGLVLVVAVAGKWGASTAAALATGMTRREASLIGVLLNTRGLTELIILNVALDLGVISASLFTILVVMALTTTLMTSPLISLLRRGEPRRLSQPAALKPPGDTGSLRPAA